MQDPAERPYSVQDFAFNPQQHSAASPLLTAKQQRTAEKRAIVAEWLFAVLGTSVPVDSDEAFRSALSDGVILCRLLNVLQPGTIARVSWGAEGGQAFGTIRWGACAGHLATGVWCVPWVGF